METPTKKLVQAQYLEPGQLLQFTGELVVSVQTAGARLASSKCLVKLQRNDGSVRVAEWSKRTKIRVVV
jgi:hypothetical protein